jgi:DNA-binding PadR family transcriptional regulator
VLEGCVLQIISQGETYGYKITDELRELGFRDVVEGTIYTILARLDKNKLVTTRKKPSEVGPPRKFFTLTRQGRKELDKFWHKWCFVSAKVNELRRIK